MPADSKSTDPIATLKVLLKEAEAALWPVQRDYFEKKKRVDLLRRAIEGHSEDAKSAPTSFLGTGSGPAVIARQFLRKEGEPRPYTDVIEAVYQAIPRYHVMPQAKIHIDRFLSRSCTAGTILYFTDDRIGLPEHAVNPKWKNGVDWAKIKKKGFVPHHMQRDKLSKILPPDILAKLLSSKRRK